MKVSKSKHYQSWGFTTKKSIKSAQSSCPLALLLIKQTREIFIVITIHASDPPVLIGCVYISWGSCTWCNCFWGISQPYKVINLMQKCTNKIVPCDFLEASHRCFACQNKTQPINIALHLIHLSKVLNVGKHKINNSLSVNVIWTLKKLRLMGSTYILNW